MKVWLLERLGVLLLHLCAWALRLSKAFDRLAVGLIVRARPIPPAPPVPRVEIPAYVPRVDVGFDDDPERTQVEVPSRPTRLPLLLMTSPDGGQRVHADQWVRRGGLA